MGHPPPRDGHLLAVLANSPLTSGTRTLRRMELAAELLGFRPFAFANIFALPSHDTGAISTLGVDAEGWLAARPAITDSLVSAGGVLLACGNSKPTGEARTHFRQQVAWVERRIAERQVPVWQVGDCPRVPLAGNDGPTDLTQNYLSGGSGRQFREPVTKAVDPR